MKYEDWAKSTDPVRPGTRCAICSNADAAADFLRFVDDVRAGKVSISLHRFYRTYLLPRYGVRANSSVYNHLHACLGIDNLEPENG